eukprot:scaffold373_cov421-Prasinococcus_capsulatus_cf.AAC.7
MYNTTEYLKIASKGSGGARSSQVQSKEYDLPCVNTYDAGLEHCRFLVCSVRTQLWRIMGLPCTRPTCRVAKYGQVGESAAYKYVSAKPSCLNLVVVADYEVHRLSSLYDRQSIDGDMQAKQVRYLYRHHFCLLTLPSIHEVRGGTPVENSTARRQCYRSTSLRSLGRHIMAVLLCRHCCGALE